MTFTLLSERPVEVDAMCASFREFYPFYLGEHRDRRCRRMHFIGSWLVVTSIVLAIATRNAWWLLGAPLCGYGFAWIGHFAFEKNRPATFRYPLYSLMGDWVMFAQALRGRITVRPVIPAMDWPGPRPRDGK